MAFDRPRVSQQGAVVPQRLTVAPALPSEWDGFSAVLRPGKAVCRIRVARGPAAGIEINGKKGEGNSFKLESEGEFDVRVIVAGEMASAAREKKKQRAKAAE